MVSIPWTDYFSHLAGWIHCIGMVQFIINYFRFIIVFEFTL